MFNSRNLGALIVAEEPHVKSWEDGQYNILNMSIEETDGFGILQEGQAIAIAKNVKVRPNEFTMPARTVCIPSLALAGEQQSPRARAGTRDRRPRLRSKERCAVAASVLSLHPASRCSIAVC